MPKLPLLMLKSPKIGYFHQARLAPPALMAAAGPPARDRGRAAQHARIEFAPGRAPARRNRGDGRFRSERTGRRGGPSGRYAGTTGRTCDCGCIGRRRAAARLANGGNVRIPGRRGLDAGMARARLVANGRAAAALVRGAALVADALARVGGDGRALPGLFLSERLSGPVTVGLLRPNIILPDRFVANEPAPRLEAALAHELAHIRNRDLWLIALSRLLMPILFAHPAYWWLRRRIRDDQEVLADAAAADGRVDYAEVLLSWARAASDRPRLAAAGSLALWERPSQLKRRIIVLLDREFRVETTCPRFWRQCVRGGMLFLILALSLVSFRPAATLGDTPRDPRVSKAEQEADAKASQVSDAGATLRVLDPAGRPAVGAKVYRSNTVFRSVDREPNAVLLGQTGRDGSFRLSAGDAKAAFDHKVRVVVTAEGSGPALTDLPAGDGMKLVRLARDDVPIRGRVLDIQGGPVAGASVQLVGILWHPSGKLDEFLEALKMEKVAYPVQYRTLRMWASDDVPSLFPAVAADRDGRFTLTGVGRERIALLLVSGPGVETRFEFVATRDMPTVKFPDFDRGNQGQNVVYHGATFDVVAGPCLEISGTVRDTDTGKPLAGAIVQTTVAFGNPLRYLKATTDAEGRYRLSGVPLKTSFGDDHSLLAAVKDGPPYLQSVQHVEDGHGPIIKDFSLKRGVWARGRVTDKATGKPIRASFDYFVREDNPHFKDYPHYGTVRMAMPFRANENGEYEIVVIPGRGILGARFGNETYRLGVGIEKIKGLKMALPGMFRARPSPFYPRNYNTVVEIDPKEGDTLITTDIELDRGRTLTGTLVGPGGKPVAGALMMGAADLFQNWSELPSADFEVHSLGSEHKRGLLFYHEKEKLAGAYVVKPDERGPLTIRLEPCGSLRGRLVDTGGLPQREVQMTCDRPGAEDNSRFQRGSLPGAIKTDRDGLFHVSGLVPGLRYTLSVWKGRMVAGEPVKDVITKSGEDKDLGDVKMGE